MSATPADDDLIRSIQNQLEGLKNTPDGVFLHRLIDRGLKKRGGNYTGDTGLDFVNFLHSLLQRYASNPDGDTVTRVKVRLLQQRLAPHLIDESEAGEAEAARDEPVVQSPENRESEPVAPDSGFSIDFTPNNKAVNARNDSAANDAHDAKPETRPPMESDDLQQDEPAFTFEADVFDLDLSEEDESSADEVDFGFVDDKRRAEKTNASEPEESSPKPESDVNSGNDAAPAQSRTAATDNAASRHEIDIEVNDSLGISSLEALEGDEDDTPIDRDLFEKVEEIDDSEPVNFGDEFNLEIPSGESDPDIIVGELTDPAPKQDGPSDQNRQAKKTPPRTTAPSSDIADSSRERVDRLHETFASKLADSVSRNKDYTNLLRSNLKALKLADRPDDVLDIKQLLVRGLEELLQGNETLNKDLGATNHYLKISQLDRNLLKDELGRVRDQSLVDDLTGLQNRTAFNKQLSAEIGRSKRYGFSLALALVYLDDFDDFEEIQGKEAGKEILRTFAQQILTGFRGYDAVARLNNNQFGILFPNTQKEGALSALEKAQKRAADTVIQFNGKSLRIPSFTSSLTLYAPGDNTEAIMKRTYDALALAGKTTRDKIIVALAQT